MYRAGKQLVWGFLPKSIRGVVLEASNDFWNPENPELWSKIKDELG